MSVLEFELNDLENEKQDRIVKTQEEEKHARNRIEDIVNKYEDEIKRI